MSILLAVAFAAAMLTTAYYTAFSFAAVRIVRGVLILSAGIAVTGLLNVAYLAAAGAVETAAIFIGLAGATALPWVAWFGWENGREARAEQVRRRDYLKAAAIVVVLAFGITAFADTTPQRAEAATVTATPTARPGLAMQQSGGTWWWRAHCGNFPFVSFEYAIWNTPFGCSIAFTNAGTNLIRSPYWPYGRTLLSPLSPLNLLYQINIIYLQAGANWCGVQGLTLWAIWRPNAGWTDLFGILPTLHCWYPVSP